MHVVRRHGQQPRSVRPLRGASDRAAVRTLKWIRSMTVKADAATAEVVEERM